MRFLENWTDVLKRAWSIRLIILAGVLSGVEAFLAVIGDVLPIPSGTFAALSALVTVGAFIARLVAQRNLSGDEA